jgi:DNA polymerase III epsilon subunit-like protein
MIALPNRVICFDCETLGLNPFYDAMTSLTALVMEDGEPTGEVFTTPIRPPLKSTKLNLEAFQVQGQFEDEDGNLDKAALFAAIERILPDNAPSLRQVMVDLNLWAQTVGAFECPNVAHKASFDLGFYDCKLACYTSLYTQCLSPMWICTIALARGAMLKGQKKFNLEECCKFLEVPYDPAKGHKSQYDAEMCGRVYFALKAHLEAPVLEAVGV